MKKSFFTLAFLLLLGSLAFAQEAAPTGTHQSPNEPNAVRPTKKHVRGNHAKAAGSDEARGAKAAGHDVVTGHPIEAGKSIGVGTGRAAKDIAEGTSSETKKGVHTTKRTTHKLHRKVTSRDRDRDDNPPQR